MATKLNARKMKAVLTDNLLGAQRDLVEAVQKMNRGPERVKLTVELIDLTQAVNRAEALLYAAVGSPDYQDGDLNRLASVTPLL